ncbi:arabinogalactan protein 23-like [Nicotiana sylvestris]|uniref:Arabinogalactan peptide 23-like n=2 Tax=Nicotiana TaxID=4085 RepID=A0A1S4CHY3_TOBAC|nr:PREDICTED: arabinogalactan peptide 23-like [Nicotiana sylvestris]XP_016500817.1 PREDICTED: arabinogalactan peptide 23-like [Nicotiana tabacum]
MEMKKIACVTLIVAGSISAAMAQLPPISAPAPAPTSDATAALPALGTLVGATFLSFFAYYMH